MARKYVIGGNWKMNKTIAESDEFLKEFKKEIGDLSKHVDIIIFPPFTSLSSACKNLKGSSIHVGAQNMYKEKKGPYTGEISPKMILETGATHVILGHSERREYFHESNEMIAAKARLAHDSNLQPVICIGETLEQRNSGQTEEVLKKQLHGSLGGLTPVQMQQTILAYEPVWAIGTGLTASPEQAQEAHQFIRSQLSSMFDKKSAEVTRIQYGGSVKPQNAKELFEQADIDGGLVGGASLDPDAFMKIIQKVPQ
ncbi:triose-phosphate isomerase [Candidatus Bathyarchaeota archaeon]|nr:triose-phosphate isomerase [Candidatus Bathyarchaeota archaeon]